MDHVTHKEGTVDLVNHGVSEWLFNGASKAKGRWGLDAMENHSVSVVYGHAQDIVNHGRTTSRNRQVIGAHTDDSGDGKSSKQMHMLEYTNDAWALRVLVS